MPNQSKRRAYSDEEGSLSPSKSPRALVKSKSDGAMNKRFVKTEDISDNEVCLDDTELTDGDEYKPEEEVESESEMSDHDVEIKGNV